MRIRKTWNNPNMAHPEMTVRFEFCITRTVVVPVIKIGTFQREKKF